MSGEVIITIKRARQTLGMVFRVPRQQQVEVINELCTEGYVTMLNHETLSIKEQDWSIFH